MAKCKTCGAEVKGADIVKVDKKSYCCLECAGIYKSIYRPEPKVKEAEE